MRLRSGLALFLALQSFTFLAPAVHADDLKSVNALPATTIPPELKDVGIFEKLGKTVSIRDLTFKDESGATVSLSKYFNAKKPVLLSLVYYECPNLCTFVLNGLVNSLKTFPWTPGKEFEIVSVSINPKDTPELATRKKAAYLQALSRPEAAAGWHFLTGEESLIKKLASEVGFGYRYDKNEGQFAHSAALFVLTPEGKISRYLYGIEYPQKDLRLALVEASQGQVGTVVDRFLLFCYRYDPQTRKYSMVLTNVMQAGAAGTTVLFGGYLAVFWTRQRKKRVVESKDDPKSA
ncbi:MAG: SCO family protein [Methylotenera sp.]|nr:SCO family protein [Oligoflexia bacterium]